jgi:hypothetical protein
MKLGRNLRHVLTLFAGFAIGIHVAVFLHELGHALGYWVSGGIVTRLVMEAPAPVGHVSGSTTNPYPYTWGGVVFGSLVTLVPLALSWRLTGKPTLRFTLLMVAAFCLSHNGLYLFVGGFLPFGDALDMIRLGAPRFLLVLMGLPLLAGSVVVLAWAIRTVGLRPEEPAWKWVVVAELGLFPVPALTLMPLLSPTASRAMQESMLLYAACYAACFALAGLRAHSAARSGDAGADRLLMPGSWRTPLVLFAAAFVLIGVEWLAFRPR